jgi:catechol 2,3-dioxygenase-like lactoylglutathione lyase family enzyme
MSNADAQIDSKSGLHRAQAITKLPATDMERARRFYEEKLGLTPSFEIPANHFTFECGGALVLLFPSSGTPSGDHDQIGWLVSDIEVEVSALKARGVEFVTYEDPGVTWRGEIGDTGASWFVNFKDSEGNLLSIIQLKG